ncbi:unnamed protein product, partial [Urochloa humidicola]
GIRYEYIAVAGRRGAGRVPPRLDLLGVAPDTGGDGNAAAAADPVGVSAEMAAARGDHVLPLRDEHVHGLGVGHGVGGPVPVPPVGARRRAVDGRGGRGGGVPGHPRRQAPRRLLPLALRVHGALRSRQPLARRARRRGGRVRRRRARPRRRRRDLLSPWDRHDVRYGKEVAYNEYYEAQLHELLTGSVCPTTFSGHACNASRQFEQCISCRDC